MHTRGKRNILILLSTLLLPVYSCSLEKIQHFYNADPYSEDRNEDFSMVGLRWGGETFVSRLQRYITSAQSQVQWNVVVVNEQEYIILDTPLKPASNDYSNNIVGGIALMMPFDNIKENAEYESDQFSYITLNSGKVDPFILDEEAVKGVISPLHITVSYNRTKGIIQGSFRGEGGEVETKEKGIQKIIIEDGVFNLNPYSKKEYTYEEWLQERVRYYPLIELP